MVRLAGAEPVIVPTSERNGWKMRAEDFENAMTPRTKMLIMNSPGQSDRRGLYPRRIGGDRRSRGRGRHLHSVRRNLREARLRRRQTRQHRFALQGSLRPDDYSQRLQQILRDDRLASRLSGCAGSHRQSSRFHPEPYRIAIRLPLRKMVHSPR